MSKTPEQLRLENELLKAGFTPRIAELLARADAGRATDDSAAASVAAELATEYRSEATFFRREPKPGDPHAELRKLVESGDVYQRIRARRTLEIAKKAQPNKALKMLTGEEE